MSPATQDPYAQLLALGVCSLDLARQGRLTELAACQQARAALMASLPAAPPPEAREALQRALVVERALEAELRAGRQAVLAALAGVRRGQRAVAGYTPARARVPAVHADA